MKDVTDLVRMGYPDGEDCPIEKCVCGKIFGYWDYNLTVGEDWECPACGRILRLGAYRITVIEKSGPTK